jgi:hypothetical protein
MTLSLSLIKQFSKLMEKMGLLIFIIKIENLQLILSNAIGKSIAWFKIEFLEISHWLRDFKLELNNSSGTMITKIKKKKSHYMKNILEDLIQKKNSNIPNNSLKKVKMNFLSTWKDIDFLFQKNMQLILIENLK